MTPAISELTSFRGEKWVTSTAEEAREPVKVLLVDDDRESLMAMYLALKNESFDVFTAQSGADALKLTLRNTFALILLDVRMPGMDGMECARKIRSREGNADLPIIFLTAQTREDARRIVQGYALGTVDYLVKPVAPELLRFRTGAFVVSHRKNEVLRHQREQLRISHNELEVRVKERTIDLAKVNDALAVANEDLKRALATLEYQKRKMYQMMDSVPGIVWELSRPIPGRIGKLTFISDYVQTLLGYSVDSCIQRPAIWFRSIHPEDRTKVAMVLKAASRDSHNSTIQFRISRNTGSYVWLEAKFALLLDSDNQPVGLCGVAMDITESRIREELLQESIAEKDLLLREIHHRVKNNLQIILSILSLQSNYIKHPELLDAFNESQYRIRSIALIHELLYENGNLTRVEFKDYLEKLVESIFRTIETDRRHINYTLNADSAPMPLDSAIHCGLIVNELLTNALKYAFPHNRNGRLDIILKVRNEQALLIIRDDGIGLPTNGTRNGNSMGLDLVDTLIRQIRGTLRTGRRNRARFSIRFPYPDPTAEEKKKK